MLTRTPRMAARQDATAYFEEQVIARESREHTISVPSSTSYLLHGTELLPDGISTLTINPGAHSTLVSARPTGITVELQHSIAAALGRSGTAAEKAARLEKAFDTVREIFRRI